LSRRGVSFFGHRAAVVAAPTQTETAFPRVLLWLLRSPGTMKRHGLDGVFYGGRFIVSLE
jgi:hypothetical protein